MKTYLKRLDAWKHKFANEDGFSLLELVVAVGILLVLTVGGLLAYNGITKNARVAAVESAASEVLTGAVANQLDNKNNTNAVDAETEWNATSKKDKSGKAQIVVKVDETPTCLKVTATHVKSEQSIRQSGTGCGSETGGENSGEAKFVPAATLTQTCEYRAGVMGLASKIRIYWATPDGYTIDDVIAKASTTGLNSTLAPLSSLDLAKNTTEISEGVYRTDVPTNLLGGLPGSESELEIAIVVVDSEGNESDPASIASNPGLISGIGGSCRNVT